jgi:hypothetical protein
MKCANVQMKAIFVVFFNFVVVCINKVFYYYSIFVGQFNLNLAKTIVKKMCCYY